MSKLLHGLFHVGMGVLTLGAACSNVLPPPYNIVVAAANEAVRAIVSVKTHKPAG